MPRRWYLALSCLPFLLLSIHHASAGSALSVDESSSRLRFEEERTEVLLAVESPSDKDFTARVRVELLDPNNVVRASAEREELVKPGSNRLRLPLPLPRADFARRRDFLWDRLRYRLTPLQPGASVGSIEGVVSVSEITPNIFELQVAGTSYAIEGMRYRARVQARHPVTSLPAKGVKLEAVARVEDDDDDDLHIFKGSATTDREGFAAFDFDLPRDVRSDELDIEIKGRLGEFEQEASDEVDFEHLAYTVVQTDKPIYQPGQTLHVRALLLDTFAQRAVSGEQVVFEISDPEGTTVFRTESRTTRFGIASADWAVAENTRLGDYRISVQVEGGRYDDSQAEQRVRVSRYELPNFSVKVKPDRDYYLPGESAEVTVSADYLFGQPVRRGRVRVVRETEREWNYREQKWETREDETFEGETDAEGRFVARINLAEAHANLGDEGGNRPFTDLSYAAYFTDPTTNRTEQRRFDLRATREAIHVYVVKNYADVAAGAPLRFYVTTFYADGRPAECEVSVYEETPTPEVASVAVAGINFREVRRSPVPQTIHTNRLGAAKVNELNLPSGERRDGNVSLHFRARDREGRTGARTEEFRMEERTLVRVETDKTIYRTGEPLKVQLTSNREEMPVAVDVWRENSVVHSATVHLRGGKALLRIPYGKNFSGKLIVRAQALPLSDGYGHPSGARAVLYPRERELRFDVRLGKEEYRPGEEASAEVRVRTADGREVESALGVVVTDRAVDERARTDQEFGQRFNYDFMRGLLGTDESFAGITRRDLDHLDLSKRLPRELDLAAEMILNKNSDAPVNVFGHEFGTDQKTLFEASNKRALSQLRRALETSYQKSGGDYPADAENLRRALAAEGVDFDALRDPWGVPYSVRFGVSADKEFLEVVSAAADKRAGTADDFIADRYEWPYFRQTGEKIERTLKEFHEQTGDFVRDREALEEVLRRVGVDLRNMRDRWGNLYEVWPDIEGRFFTFQFRSAGPDGRFYTNSHYSADDFIVWTARTDYFADTEKRIAAALDRHLDAGGSFPQTEEELREVLGRAGVGDSLLLDPWGKPYRITFNERAFGGGRVTLRTYPRHGGPSGAKAEKLATVHKLHVVTLRSYGKDRLPETWDDQYISSLSRIQSEPDETASKLKARQASGPTIAATQGMIAGTVVDANGAHVPGASVKLTNRGTGFAHSTATNHEGFFSADNLPVGVYEISITSPGFVTLLITDIGVQLASVTEINAWLDVGAVTETVEVTSSDVIRVETSMTTQQIQALPAIGRQPFELLSMSANIEVNGGNGRVVNGQRAALTNIVTRSGGQNSTPRLREYFPETLFWQPSVETDASGRALLNFKLADNITTWKMALVGSTADGEIGLFEREIRAFQPFFIEHDPPRVLTEGDEISLPVVLRNYLDRPQAVELEIKPEIWFTMLGPAAKRTEVAAGDAARETFDFRVSASVKDGKQRVTALASDEPDAVEKKVSVHPDGEEITDTQGQVFGERGTLDIEIPASTIAGTARAELKIYPNLLTHVVEGVEGIMKRPYGCGEQTISSTYPSLLILRHYKQAAGEPPPIARRAEEYVRAGYERLLGYQMASGGFTYWGRGEPNFALTVYALRFLKEASEFVPVDESVIGGASRWLISQQRADGSWPAQTWDSREEARRTIMLTAYIARVLALPSGKSSETSASVSSTTSDEAKARARAQGYLAPRVEKSEDPYTLASYALAAETFGDRAAASNAARRLASLALPEKNGTYWEARQETPFHGWGLAGRIETTALAVRALALEGKAYETQISAGLLYLLKNKDRYGVWYSTQATINVLDTLIAFASDPATASAEAKTTADAASGQTANSHAEIYVNGRYAAKVEMPPAGRLSAPLTVDLTPFLSAPGANRVEIRRGATATRAAAQVVANYYVPWAESPSVMRHNKVAQVNVPSLKVTFDRTEGKPTEEIACAVEVARAPSGGYGMMLAEIGLPPGAEVDRASLERAIKETGSGLDRYDVLPDRIIAYVWPTHGTQAARFTFKFRPRYGINALTAPSQVYDYYNPEAQTVVAPTRFVIR